MSAGQFLDSKYASNDGLVFPVRLQPETLALTLGGTANTATADAIDAGLPTLVTRKSRKGFGVHPRSVTVRLTADGTGQTADYEAEGTLHTIPVLQAATWEGYTKGATGTYLGIACILVSKTPEQVR
jgi:hypothetical protein